MSSTEEEAVTSDNVHRLWKRKYHRHAKPDTNAPLKPPSAYVMFSNDVRAELKQQNKSFTDLAKIIGDRWKNISSENKELYESNAFRAREEYLKKVEEYQKTDSYKKYQKYLSDFKAENEAAARPVGRPRKRHRRDEEKELSDGTTSDSTRQNRRTSSISSQPEDRHQRTLSLSSDLRHYPFYLLNEDSAGSSSPTPPANNNQVQSDTLTDRPPNLKKSPKRHTPKK
ncbi:MAG: high mobility group box domain-containing protein [Benjaminiella poitrasii]|nr:MAG: high mobility group box domain-containing protein [Benjaminiella poitrasii]